MSLSREVAVDGHSSNLNLST